VSFDLRKNQHLQQQQQQQQHLQQQQQQISRTRAGVMNREKV
jgi:hypothetical protein